MKYNTDRLNFIFDGESYRAQTYSDTRGNPTIGIGFNFVGAGAKTYWNDFRNENPSYKLPSYEDIKSNNFQGVKINLDVAEGLANHVLESKEQELKNHYGDAWGKFSSSEKIAIEDAYYNGGGSLVGMYKNSEGKLVETKFSKNMKLYAETGDEMYLANAANELQNNSNPQGSPDYKGIQNRRNDQTAKLLEDSSIEYQKPGDFKDNPYATSTGSSAKETQTKVGENTAQEPENDDSATPVDNDAQKTHVTEDSDADNPPEDAETTAEETQSEEPEQSEEEPEQVEEPVGHSQTAEIAGAGASAAFMSYARLNGWTEEWWLDDAWEQSVASFAVSEAAKDIADWSFESGDYNVFDWNAAGGSLFASAFANYVAGQAGIGGTDVGSTVGTSHKLTKKAA